MTETEIGRLVEYIAFDVVFGVRDGIVAGDGDLVSIKDLHDDSFGVVILSLFGGWGRDCEEDGDGQLLLGLQGALEDFGVEESVLVQDEFEECVAITAIVEVDGLGGGHL